MDDERLEGFGATADAVLYRNSAVLVGTLVRETVSSNVVHRLRRPKSPDAECPLTS